MLKFFKRIRLNLFFKNRFGQYLIYAVGEVFLVILGILIAVNLNNANERRKELKDINIILRDVQIELDQNIRLINSFYQFAAFKDSVAFNYFNKALVDQHIEEVNISAYASLSINYRTVDLQFDAYEALLQKAESIPDEYKPLLQRLKTLYVNRKERVDKMNTKIAALADEVNTMLLKSQAWYVNLIYRKEPPDQLKKFLLTNQEHINYASYYSTVLIENLYPRALEFKESAISTYRDIDRLLEETQTSFDYEPSFKYNEEDYQSWLGTYDNGANTLTISLRDGVLMSGENEIYPLNKRDFHLHGFPYFFKMIYKDSLIDRFDFHYPNNRYSYKRID